MRGIKVWMAFPRKIFTGTAICISLIYFGGAHQLGATTYNVSPTGSGTSELQGAIEVAGPGDTIILADGVYRAPNRNYLLDDASPPNPAGGNSLLRMGAVAYFRQSGQPGAPITVKAANSGKAILKGSVKTPHTKWTLHNSSTPHIYKITTWWPTEANYNPGIDNAINAGKAGHHIPQQVIFYNSDADANADINPTLLVQRSNPGPLFPTNYYHLALPNGSPNDLEPGEFFWQSDGSTSGGTLYARFPGNADPRVANSKIVEISVAANLIGSPSHGGGANYIVLEGLKFRHSNTLSFTYERNLAGNPGLGFCAVGGYKGVYIKDCDVSYMDNGGVAVGADSTIENTIIANNGCIGGGIQAPNTKFIRCRIFGNNYKRFSTVHHAGGLKLIGSEPTGAVIDCEFFHNYGPSFWCDTIVPKAATSLSSPVVTLRNSYIHDNYGINHNVPQRSGGATPMVPDGLGHVPAIMLELSTNVLVYNNLIERNPHGIWMAGSSRCTVTNNIFRENPVIGSTALDYTAFLSSAGYEGAYNGPKGSFENIISNNIFWNDNAKAIWGATPNGASSADGNNTIDYNVYWRSDAPVGFYGATFLKNSGIKQPLRYLSNGQWVLGFNDWQRFSAFDKNSIAPITDPFPASVDLTNSLLDFRARFPSTSNPSAPGGTVPNLTASITSGSTHPYHGFKIVQYYGQTFVGGTGIFSDSVESLKISLKGELVARFVEGAVKPGQTTDTYGQMLMDAGTNDRPGYGFDGDEDTGIYHGGQDILGIAAGGRPTVVVNLSNVTIEGVVRQQAAPNYTSPPSPPSSTPIIGLPGSQSLILSGTSTDGNTVGLSLSGSGTGRLGLEANKSYAITLTVVGRRSDRATMSLTRLFSVKWNGAGYTIIGAATFGRVDDTGTSGWTIGSSISGNELVITGTASGAGTTTRWAGKVEAIEITH